MANKKIFIIAGEASGDQHAADLVSALKEKDAGLEFCGIGGDTMKAAGVELLYHMSQLAVLGITEIIRHLPFIRKVQNRVRAELRQKMDAIILVDYPGFNLRIAKMAKEVGVPVIYYISPQLWAWGEKRVEKMRRYVDLLLVLFQFEEDFYEKYRIKAHFVGHPLVDQIQIKKEEAQFRRDNNLPEELPIIGMLPGSREMEVRKLLPIMVKSALALQEKHKFVPIVGRASQLPLSLYEEYIPFASNIRLISSQTHLVMGYSHAAMVASGTATLELGYLQTPMVVLYSVSPLTYWLGKKLVKIKNIALANIVAGRQVVPEFIQRELTPENVSAAIERYLTDAEYHRSVREDLRTIKAALGQKGASARAADKIISFLKERP